MAGRIQAQRMDEMGCNVVETSAHGGARPDHSYWQGKRFYWSGKGGRNVKNYPDFIQSTGYGTGPGLCGWNCRHSYFPVPDVDAPLANTARHLQELNDETVTYNGKTMSQYDASQRQREIERQIRKYKREQSAFPKGSEEYGQATAKVREWQAKQRDFTDQTGRRRDYFRERAGTQLSGGAKGGILNSANTPQKLNVVGGTDRLSKEIVEQEIGKIPKTHVEIAEKQISEIRIVAGGNSSYYDPTTKNIVISDVSSRGAVIHEVAHAIEREKDLYNSSIFRDVWLDGLQNVQLDNIIWDNKTFAEGVWRLEHQKFISAYQGRFYEDRWPILEGQELSFEGRRDYFSEGYREFIENPNNLLDKDTKLYHFIEGLKL
jgi:hypothetical protein